MNNNIFKNVDNIIDPKKFKQLKTDIRNKRVNGINSNSPSHFTGRIMTEVELKEYNENVKIFEDCILGDSLEKFTERVNGVKNIIVVIGYKQNQRN